MRAPEDGPSPGGRTARDEPGRLPDFIVIGAAKAGTTSLFRWLDAQPECRLPDTKEPRFFSHDERWQRGVDWYRSMLAGDPERLVGEASVAYTDPAFGERAAARMASVVPGARLVYLVRDPVARLRSHYRHQVLKGREREPLGVAVARPGNEYVGCSQYHRCLTPYMGRFERSQLCVVRFEDLVGDGHAGWLTVLDHLGLSHRPPPGEAHNASNDKTQFRRRAAGLASLVPGRLVRRIPGPLRSLGRRAVTRTPDAGLLDDSANDGLPSPVVDALAEDAARLATWLGTRAPLWSSISDDA